MTDSPEAGVNEVIPSSFFPCPRSLAWRVAPAPHRSCGFCFARTRPHRERLQIPLPLLHARLWVYFPSAYSIIAMWRALLLYRQDAGVPGPPFFVQLDVIYGPLASLLALPGTFYLSSFVICSPNATPVLPSPSSTGFALRRSLFFIARRFVPLF